MLRNAPLKCLNYAFFGYCMHFKKMRNGYGKTTAIITSTSPEEDTELKFT